MMLRTAHGSGRRNKQIALLIVLLSASMALAGCGGKDTEGTDGTGPVDPGTTQLKDGMGAIAGLLLDDRYRPIADATVLIEETGDTTTSDADGEFYFVDLAPGTYRLRTDAEGHEALPVVTKVEEGLFAEQRIIARRIVSESSTIITREFSVFIPCAADFVVNGVVADCTLDLSGDTFRSGFTVNTSELGNVTYLVTELKADAVGDYVVQVREDDGSNTGGERYAVGTILEGDYIKIVNQLGVTNTENNDQDNNVPWNNTLDYETILFMQGKYQKEFHDAGEPVAGTCVPGVVCVNNPTPRGVGAQFGIRATFVQSIFLGEPEVDVDTYHTF